MFMGPHTETYLNKMEPVCGLAASRLLLGELSVVLFTFYAAILAFTPGDCTNAT